MNRYLMSVPKYFGGDFRFEVEAENKEDAIIKGAGYIQSDPSIRGTVMKDHLTCVRKCKPSFGEKYEKKMQSFK